MVDLRPSGARRDRALLRFSRLRFRPDQDAAVGGRARPARAAGLSDRACQSRSPSPGARRCSGERRRAASTAARCSCSISTASRRSTTRSGTRRATPCCGWCRCGCATKSATRVKSGALAATNSRSCFPATSVEGRPVEACARHHRQPVAALHDQRHGRVDRRVGGHRHLRL